MPDTIKSSCEFRTEAGLVVQRLQSAIADVLRSVGGARIHRAARLAEELDLASGLAWKIFRSAEGEDPYSAAQYLPGAEGARIFLAAARKRKVAAEILARVEQGFRDFEEFVSAQAGSRKSFNMLVAGQSRAERERTDLSHRKNAFESLSYIRGVQARCVVLTYILQASDDERHFDLLSIRGLVDMRRIRSVVPWCMSRTYSVNDVGKIESAGVREPLEPESASSARSGGLPLLTRFCSSPDINFQRVRRPNGIDDYLLVDDRLGNAGLTTCFTGEVLRAAEPRYRDATHTNLLFMPPVRTPCETFLMDVLVHRDLFGPLQFQSTMYCDAGMRDPTEPFYEWEKLPLFERPEHLGMGLTGVHAPEVPSYLELIRYAFERVHWDSSQFDAYRLRVGFPPVPATITLSHPLPQRPAEPGI